MLERLMVNESEGAEKVEKVEKTEKSPLSAKGGRQDTREPETASSVPPPVPAHEPEADVPSLQQTEQEDVSFIATGPSDAAVEAERPSRLRADEAAGSPQEQTAEQALAALRELAEGTRGSKSSRDETSEAVPAEAAPPDAAASQDGNEALEELRRLAGRAISDEAPETEQETEEDIDVVSRSSALERLMQEATRSQPVDGAAEEAGLEELIRGEAAGISDKEDGKPAAAAQADASRSASSQEDTLQQELAQLENATQSSAEAENEPPAASEKTAGEESGEEVAAETLQKAASTTSAEQALAEEPARDKVVPFPGAAAEEPPSQESEIAAASSSKDEIDSSPGEVAAEPQGTKEKPEGHPLLSRKLVLEPMVDLFGSQYGQPATEESQSGWGEFVSKVNGNRTLLKDLNGVIQAQVLLSYPSGPGPAELKSELDLDLALLNALPDSVEPPSLEMERVEAPITDFKADCMHPELVLLNFAISTSQASAMVDASALLSQQAPLADGELFPSSQAECRVTEPHVALAIPADFLRHCSELGPSYDADFISTELIMAGAAVEHRADPDSGDSKGETGSRSGPERARSLNQPRFGTMYPDGLIGDATATGSQSDQSLTADRLVGAEPESQNSSTEPFPPIDETGKARSKQDSAKDAGVFQPALETKRPVDRDLSDYV